MPRVPRKKLQFDEDSVNNLLQEIYNDSHNIKAKISRLFNKWEKYANDGGEVSAVGDQIVKLINAESKNQDQKIMLLRYLKEVVFEKEKKSNNNNNSNGDGSQEGVTSSDDRNQLIKFVQSELQKKNQ